MLNPVDGSDWVYGALCRGQEPNQWVSADAKADYAHQRTLCRRCPVRQSCLDYALADPSIVGCWGGTTERERWELRRGSGLRAS
jgi:WhiB family transcriptional regulator, redox-sensing transcriptional regulator